jgi:hypothetical protein
MAVTGCEICWPEDGELARKWKPSDPASVVFLIDDSHLFVSIHQCACGQRFLRLFAECIDWVGGNDPSSTVRFPVLKEEAERLILAKGDDTKVLALVVKLGTDQRRLESWWPSSGARVTHWTSGAFSIPRHD